MPFQGKDPEPCIIHISSLRGTVRYWRYRLLVSIAIFEGTGLSILPVLTRFFVK